MMQRPAGVLLCMTTLIWSCGAATSAATAPDAIAVADGRITAIVTTAAIRALSEPATQIYYLHGRRIVPGFNDAHWHLPSRRSARLDNAGSVAVIRERMQAY